MGTEFNSGRGEFGSLLAAPATTGKRTDMQKFFRIMTKRSDPVRDCSRGQIEFLLPRCVRLRASVPCEETARPAIARLFLRSCPPAVIRRVIGVIVDSFKRHAWNRLAHVVKEVIEVLPSFTDFDAASAILRPVRIALVFAPSEHTGPYFIYARATHAVLHGSRQSRFASQASATFGVAVSQGLSGECYRGAALADAIPSGVTPKVLFRSGNDS